MKVLLINGSPHNDGCINFAFDQIIEELNQENIETEKIWLGIKPIASCIGCGSCIKNGECFVGDIVNDISKRLDEFDGIIVGSAVHYASATGAITSFLDRLFYSSSSKLTNKVWASVVSCRRGGATSTFDMLNKYPLINNMFIVGSSYWNQIHGNNKLEAKCDLEGIQTMKNIAKNMAYLIKCINKSNVEKPKYDKIIRTNFIDNKL